MEEIKDAVVNIWFGDNEYLTYYFINLVTFYRNTKVAILEYDDCDNAVVITDVKRIEVKGVKMSIDE